MTYFRTGAPYYHRRAAVSRSCSGWEGVVPAGYCRQALIRHQRSGIRNQIAIRDAVPLMQKVRVGLGWVVSIGALLRISRHLIPDA